MKPITILFSLLLASQSSVVVAQFPRFPRITLPPRIATPPPNRVNPPRPTVPPARPRQSINLSTFFPTSSAQTAAACAVNDAACNSCQYFAATVLACEIQIPNFDDLTDFEQAKCLCYQPGYFTVTAPLPTATGTRAATGTALAAPVPSLGTDLIYAPNQFDGPINACISWASVSASASLPYFTPIRSWCNTAGNVRAGAKTDFSPGTTAGVFLDDIIEWKDYAAVGVNTSNTVLLTGGGATRTGTAGTGATGTRGSGASATGTGAAALAAVPTGLLGGLVGMGIAMLAAL